MHRLISVIHMPDRLDRILDGFEVDVESAAIPGPGGAGILVLACGATIRLSDYDVAILPPLRRHRVQSEDVRRIRVSYRGVVNLFDNLDDPLVFPLEHDDMLGRCTAQLVSEMTAGRPGRRTMVGTLLRELLILTVRRCFERGKLRDAWLTALDDPRLGQALTAMRDHPDHTFTVAELAEVAGMSRTVFAARFVEALAQPPFEFLTRLRLERAAHL